jgi:hypothetical protein
MYLDLIGFSWPIRSVDDVASQRGCDAIFGIAKLLEYFIRYSPNEVSESPGG